MNFAVIYFCDNPLQSRCIGICSRNRRSNRHMWPSVGRSLTCSEEYSYRSSFPCNPRDRCTCILNPYRCTSHHSDRHPRHMHRIRIDTQFRCSPLDTCSSSRNRNLCNCRNSCKVLRCSGQELKIK